MQLKALAIIQQGTYSIPIRQTPGQVGIDSWIPVQILMDTMSSRISRQATKDSNTAETTIMVDR